jgi:hypothetical protein
MFRLITAFLLFLGAINSLTIGWIEADHLVSDSHVMSAKGSEALAFETSKNQIPAVVHIKLADQESDSEKHSEHRCHLGHCSFLLTFATFEYLEIARSRIQRTQLVPHGHRTSTFFRPPRA